jgi:uncharacterized protein
MRLSRSAANGGLVGRCLPLACLCALALFQLGGICFSAEVLPPKPANYFNDYAHVVSPATATLLNTRLEEFERKTSNQILVVVFPKMESPSSIEDYTVRLAQAWGVGQKQHNNGAVLFVFIQDRKMYIQVGYGLEGALPDATAKQIIENEIKPRFRKGDYDGGLTAGVNAILAATQGEYRGTGRTVAESGGRTAGNAGVVSLLIFTAVIILILWLVVRASLRGLRGGSAYRRRGYRGGGWTIGSGGWGSSGWGGGGWGGGGSSGGGSFSSGGGSFGGGGAGGSW